MTYLYGKIEPGSSSRNNGCEETVLLFCGCGNTHARTAVRHAPYQRPAISIYSQFELRIWLLRGLLLLLAGCIFLLRYSCRPAYERVDLTCCCWQTFDLSISLLAFLITSGSYKYFSRNKNNRATKYFQNNVLYTISQSIVSWYYTIYYGSW